MKAARRTMTAKATSWRKFFYFSCVWTIQTLTATLVSLFLSLSLCSHRSHRNWRRVRALNRLPPTVTTIGPSINRSALRQLHANKVQSNIVKIRGSSQQMSQGPLCLHTQVASRDDLIFSCKSFSALYIHRIYVTHVTPIPGNSSSTLRAILHLLHIG